MYFIIYRIAMSWTWSSILGSTKKKRLKKKNTSKSRGLRQTHLLTGPVHCGIPRQSCVQSAICVWITSSLRPLQHASGLLEPGSSYNMPSLPSFTLQGLSMALEATNTNESEGAVPSLYPVPRHPGSSLTSPRSTSHPAMP